jgi:mono/diheme cytochrome c family protein
MIRPLHTFLSVAIVAALAGCGGGGGSTDQPLPAAPPPPERTGVTSFLLFPNPQEQPDGTIQMNTQAYADAYYRAIDPNNERDTLAKYKARNGFETGSGTEISVIFGDRRDLGYGRRMYARQNPDGTLAFYVENYLVQAGAGYTYSPLNLDAAIVRDTARLVGVNGIEFSPGPNGGVSFPKFYNFNGAGVRQSFVNLDGQGLKAMPGPCISCHGGRGDALTPPDATGKPLFNLVQNGESLTRGDVQAHMHPFEPDVFDFSTTRPGYSRAEQEAGIKAINRMILCTYPIAAASTAPEDACRRQAGGSEWLGTQAAVIKSAYGGDGLPAATWNDNYVPPDWLTAGQSTLYREVVATSCRTCHAMRGNAAQSDIDFTSYAKFASYSDRIKAHVFERGNMPLAKIVYEAFWHTPGRAQLLADFLQQQGYDVRNAAGQVVEPGGPVAVAGPDRVVRPGATTLTASGSLYSDSYAWTLVSGPAGATLTGASTVSPTFAAQAEGTYVLQLIARQGSTSSVPVQLTIVVKATAPANVHFADIKAIMQTPGLCVACHSPTGQLPRPPVFYSDYDRNADSMVDATDEAWLYQEVRSRINFTDLAASPLLRKPSNHHHKGGLIAGFNSATPPGDDARVRYDTFLNWILAGAPQ